MRAAESTRIGLLVGLVPTMREAGELVRSLEGEGLESVTLSEAYTFDAVSQLGYLAACTSDIELATGILSIFTRTPTALAMTAAGLDFASEGRFRLGIGASGPQVVDGFHGVQFDAPLGRTQEVVEICRRVWRRERLRHEGRWYPIPRTPGMPALKLINEPVRTDIPISIAGTGERTVELAARVADAWEPIFFHPGRAEEVWGGAIARGTAARSPELPPLRIVARVPVAVGPDTVAEWEKARAQLALYVGGMGSREQNFYNDLVIRYGYEDVARKVQDAYLDGRVKDAVASVPDELVQGTTLIGTADTVAERLAEFTAAGVDLLTVQPMSEDPCKLGDVVRVLRSAAEGGSPKT